MLSTCIGVPVLLGKPDVECFRRVVQSPGNTKAQVLLQEQSALIDRVINEYSDQPPKCAGINAHIEIQLLNFNSKIQQHPSHLNLPLRFTVISISIGFPPQRPASIYSYQRERRNLPLMPGILHSGFSSTAFATYPSYLA